MRLSSTDGGNRILSPGKTSVTGDEEATRNDPDHFSAGWPVIASTLACNVSKTRFEKTRWSYKDLLGIDGVKQRMSFQLDDKI